MKKNYPKKENNTAPFVELNEKARFSSKKTALLILLFLSITSSFGQGASCGTAVGLTVNAAPVTGLANDTTVNDPTAATCITGTIVQDGWYSFSATQSTATVTVKSNNRQLVIYAYSGACGSLTQIGCSNSNTMAGPQTEVMNLTGLTAGTTYYVRVGNHGAGASITLNEVSVSTPAVNDLCSGAITLTSNTSCVTTTGSTVGATDNNETGECTTSLGTTQNTVWYQFQAVATTHVVTVDGNTGFDAVLNVISNCGSATTPTGGGCIDATGDGGIETRTLTGLTIGNFYRIQIHDYYAVQMANAFTICVTHAPAPTMTNLSAASGCVGSSLTITGTNFTGATAVTIGGTAATITANTGTSITVTVGTGTTGTVSVTTPGGTVTSASTPTPTFTVNALPANPANPTSNSPQCNPPGVTITRAAVPPGTENYYWQTASLGTSTANNSSTYTATASGTYYIRAQTISTGCWSSGQGSLAVIVDTAISTLATSPSPSDASTGVCYSGGTPVTSVSWTAAAGATSYDVYFGAGSLPGSVTSTVATTSYTTGALAASTTYYWKIVPKNSCGFSSGTPITWTFTTASAPCICTPTGNLDCTVSDYISNVTFNSLNNTTTCGAGGYTIYPASGSQTTTLTTSQTYTFSLSVGSGSGTHGAGVWIDFNQNGVFTDAGEFFLVSNAIAASSTVTTSITIPAGATLGLVKMRVRYAYNLTVASTMSCAMAGTYGETEDYWVTLTAPILCTTPTDQPTSLVLSSITSTSMSGSFTAAVTVPSGYFIVRSTSATPPSPVNGTTYAAGSTALGVGTLVIQGSNTASLTTTFSDTTLTSNTRYYYYIFSFNNGCTGAPYYFTSSPLSNTAITCVAALSSGPVNSAITGTSCTITWGASPAGGGAAGITYSLEVYTDSGYTSPISGSPFSVGATTYSLSGLTGGTVYYYRVRASNGCYSAYLSNTVTTTLTNDDCSGATLLAVSPNSGCTTSTTATSAGATQSQAGCTGNADDDVWFKFVATGTSHVVTVTPITLNNAVFEVFSGNCAGLSSTICVNNTTGASAETTTLTGLTAGTTYYVRVYSNGNAANAGTFTICVTSPVPPANNQCANATNLPCGTTNLAGTTVLANSYTHGTGCSMSNYGVWYSFAGDGNSSTISVTTTSNDVELSISSGSCGSLTNITCQDLALSSGTETYTFTTAVGVTYYVYVANYYTSGTSTDTGTFTISRSCVVPFNPCTSIPNIASCGTSTTATIASGSGGYTPSSCGWTTPGVERIYTFTPASTGNFTITQSSSYAYIDYQFKPVSAGCSSSGWSCIDDISGAGTSPSFTMTAGVQYYILLDPESSSGGNVTFTINCPTPPLSNDEPCNAIALTVNTTCSYSTYTNSGAAASGGVPDPGCGGYVGGDVWFTAVVPATGELDVDLQTGVMTDSGMAFYSGTCGSLTLLECDNDDSPNGLMSNISMTGLTPGQTIYIRVWEYNNDNNGTFGICATTPSCPSPYDLYANILSNTSVTVNWLVTSPSSNGYQYYINTTGVAPTAATTPTGSTAAGVYGVTLTGLTPGLKYYFWVRSYCGGTDYSTWFGPTNYTPCNVGSGFGTTSLTCPSITAGVQGTVVSDPPALTCSALTCVNLEASYLQLSQPTDYTVSSIPYSIPYQYTCLQNPVSVNVDDVWSNTINLPFNFCYYGNNYNKCLIGSNGVITFDTTTYAPGGYNNWSFNTDLPSTSLFKNTIFGVYHDIDPSKGGQVGWELITLNTGCRALVASWNDIPMYSSTCNSQLYTGMIVLYENTNVIEVYIKEKNVCGTWNNGNAIVGLQNATGTAAVVAPNRNGLSTNWTVAQPAGEAWRFTPSGPTLTSIQWYQGNSVATGTPIAGATTDVISVCPTVTTTYTAEVTYALCTGNLKYSDNSVVTVNGNKIWNGASSTDWNTANNWTPSGVPTSANCVVIPVTANNPVISNTPDAVGYNLAVYNGAQLTLNSTRNLTITDKVTVQPTGTFTLNNSSSLIQINNVLNTGNIIYKREAPSVRTLDYVYWGSPVSGFSMANLVSPYSFGAMYQWNTTASNNNGGQGIWQNFSGTMVPGKGYIARTPGATPFNNTTTNVLSATFTGVPNNGNITVPLERGTDQNTAYHTGTNGVQITNLSDNWNLLGNPYPSAIRASQFLFDNNTKVEGNVRLWTHGTLPSIVTPNPFYGSYLSNYTPGDYMTYNFTGTSCCPAAASDLFIGAGQGFFVQMVDGPPVAAADYITVAFNNNLRSATYSNSTFYKTQNPTTASASNVDSIERNRIWLDFINPNHQTDRILFGYIENATMGRDSFYDCITQNTGGNLIYSMVGDTKFAIQGRALPFDATDEVAIGFNANSATQGNYTIGIAAVDGLFNNQNIYLKDNLLNITHDLKANPYVFTTQNGEVNNRFKIVYIDNALGTPTHTLNANSVKVITNTQVSVTATNLQMKSIEVYNLLGQRLDVYKNINADAVILHNLQKQNATLLLKIKLDTGEIVTKKINF